MSKTKSSQVKKLHTEKILKEIVKAIDAKKAENLQILDVRGISTITDYLIIATGTSEPHLRALRIEVEKVLDANQAPIAGFDAGNQGSGWIVTDAYQIMVHIFTEEKRDIYTLEKLWQDAKKIPVKRLLSPSPKANKKKSIRSTASKSTTTKKTKAPKKPSKRKSLSS